MVKNKTSTMTSVITMENATEVFPKLIKEVKGSKKRYFLSLEGRPQVVVLGFEDFIRSILRSGRSKVVTKIQEEATAKGLNKLTLKDINAEVKACRKAKK